MPPSEVELEEVQLFIRVLFRVNLSNPARRLSLEPIKERSLFMTGGRGSKDPVHSKHAPLRSRAGRSPTFRTHGLVFLALAGTRGLTNPIEYLPSFKVDPDLWVPINSSTQESQTTFLPRLGYCAPLKRLALKFCHPSITLHTNH